MLSQYFSEEETICLLAVVAIIGFVGLVLNLLLISSIIFTDGFSESPANIFVLSLALVDALMDCMRGGLVALYVYNMYYPALNISLTVSKLFALATTGSIFLLTLNRTISIVRSLRYPTIVTNKRAKVMVGVMWLVAFIVVVLDEVSLIFSEIPNLKMTRFFVAFYIVSSILLCVYMYLLGRKHAKRLAQQAYAISGQLQVASHEFRTLRSLFMIAGSFGVCWLPVTLIAVMINNGERDPALFYRALCFAVLLTFLNTIIDPVVYYFRSKGFRLSLKRLKRQITNSGYCECC